MIFVLRVCRGTELIGCVAGGEVEREGQAGSERTSLGRMMLLVLAAAFWGTSAPILKQALEENNTKIDERRRTDGLSTFLRSIALEDFVKNLSLKVTLVFLTDQIGSVCFMFGAGKHGAAIAGPFANSIKFIFTAITEALLLKKLPPRESSQSCLTDPFEVYGPYD